MTPEDRAFKALEEMHCDDLLIDGALEEVIAREIRASEVRTAATIAAWVRSVHAAEWTLELSDIADQIEAKSWEEFQ